MRSVTTPRLAVAAALLSASFFLSAALAQASRPLMYDDVNFALAARAVAETGLPFGNQGWMGDRGDLSQREQWALWHPPLYIYLLGLTARLLGPSEVALRLPGVLAGLLSAWLTFALASQVTRGSPSERRLAGSAAAVLVLISPLWIQSTLILDIDFALLLPLTLLFLWLYLRWEATPRWPLLAPLFGLLLWAKMTNPLALLGAVLAWQLLQGKLRRAAAHALGIGLGGALLFGVSWLAIGTWLGFPLDMPFGVNAAQWQDSSDVARRAYQGIGAFIEGLQPTVLWIGPGLLALGLAAAAVRAGQLAETWCPRGVDLLLGLATLFVAGYVNKSAGWFPKYQVGLVPLLAVAAAPLLARALRSRPLFLLPATLAALGAGWVTYRLVRDDWALARWWVIGEDAATWLLGIFLASLGLTAALFLNRVTSPSRHPPSPDTPAPSSSRSAGLSRLGLAVPVLLAGLSVGWSLALDAVHLRADYSTTYWYGTTGTREASAWLDAHLPPGTTYLASKEVAYAASNQRYVDQDSLLAHFERGGHFDGSWAGEPIRALVLWTGEPYVATMFETRLLESGYHATGRVGDYVIYEPSGASSPPDPGISS